MRTVSILKSSWGRAGRMRQQVNLWVEFGEVVPEPSGPRRLRALGLPNVTQAGCPRHNEITARWRFPRPPHRRRRCHRR